MNTHAQIIRAATVSVVCRLLNLSDPTVRSWINRNSIPAEHWKALSEAGFATLEDLANAAATRSEAA